MRNNSVSYDVNIGGKSVLGVIGIELLQSMDDLHQADLAIRQSVFLNDRAQDFLDNSLTDQLLSQPLYIEMSNQSGKRLFFEGIITSVCIRNSNNFDHYIQLTAAGLPLVFAGERHRRTFVQKTLADIVKEVESSVNFEKRIHIKTSQKEVIPFVMQYDESNWEFLRRLAADFGEWFFYNGQELYFGERPREESDSFTINGVNLASRETRLFSLGTKAWSYEPAEDQIHEAEESPNVGFFQDVGAAAVAQSQNLFSKYASNVVAPYEVKSKKAIIDFAKTRTHQESAWLDTLSGNSIQPNLAPGIELNVNLSYPPNTNHGNGKEVNQDVGEFVVVSVRHFVGHDQEYHNSFEAISASSSHQPFTILPRQPLLNPELAVVINNQDEKSQGRIKCRFIWSNGHRLEASETDWIRLMLPYTADGDGYIWLPEKDAQVIIGFYRGSSYQPYIMGGIYHGKNQSEIGHTPADNLKKQIRTAGGNQILIDDSAGTESITVTNSANKDAYFKITFSTHQTIEIACNGDISLKADKQINMEAEQINIKAQNGLSMESGQKANLKTSQLVINADTKADLSSGGTMKINAAAAGELSSGAVLTVKGSLIKIN